METKICFIENLSVYSILKTHILFKTANKRVYKNVIYYIDSTRYADMIKKIYGLIYSVPFIKFNFSFENTLDEKRSVYGFKKIHEDISEIWESIYNKEFTDCKNIIYQNYFLNYLKKNILSEWPCYGNEVSLIRILLMLHATENHVKNYTNDKILFLIEKRPWIRELSSYASKHGIDISEVKPILQLSKSKVKKLILSNKYLTTVIDNIFHSINLCKDRIYKISTNKKMVKYLLNNRNPELSMLVIDSIIQYFGSSKFWISTNLPRKNIMFVSKSHKINQNELNDIRNNGMEFIALANFVGNGSDASIFRTRNNTKLSDSSKNNSWESTIIKQQKNKYIIEKNYWSEFFKTYNVKIYATLHKWSSHPAAAAEAIKELGGISVLWQTSYYETLNQYASVNADVYFSFSTKTAQIEKQNKSSIKYIVGVGYIFDYNFDAAKTRSNKIKHYLGKNNAQRILSIFDGGSSEDERWGVGNINLKKDYQFFLEKVLEEKWLGLIVKSKKPGSLRMRLGNVSELLDSAIDTGRCYFSEDTDYYDKNLSIRPADAALASDIAIHLCLYAGSAGLEAALTDTPTLLLDRYNLHDSQFYKLDKGKVVFNGLSEMWDNIKEHWEREAIPGFGDWAPIINDIDPFRDGKAAYRMNSFMLSLLDGFKTGYEREEILENAVHSYCKQWGYDKISAVE